MSVVIAESDDKDNLFEHVYAGTYTIKFLVALETSSGKTRSHRYGPATNECGCFMVARHSLKEKNK